MTTHQPPTLHGLGPYLAALPEADVQRWLDLADDLDPTGTPTDTRTLGDARLAQAVSDGTPWALLIHWALGKTREDAEILLQYGPDVLTQTYRTRGYSPTVAQEMTDAMTRMCSPRD
ncbi:hypothetical protein [Streptomyces sp. NPDC055607]